MHRTTIQYTIVALTLLAPPTAHAQWELENSGTKASLRGITNVGGGVAWASGTDGTVIRTEDGGTRWQRCTTPPGAEHLDFRGVQAFDENTAIVMSSGPGDQSRLYKTTDGCQTWKLLFTNPDKDGFWDALLFYQGALQSRTSAMLVGDPVNGMFAVFSTDDGGTTWKRWGSNAGLRAPRAAQGESLFAASNSSLASPGINGEYVFVTGGGKGARLLFEQGHSPFDASSWQAFSAASLPLPANTSAGAFSIARRGDEGRTTGHYVVVGGDYTKPDVGSAAFAYQPALLARVLVTSAQTPPHGYRSSVAYDPTTKTWITVGPNGSDFSTDDGRNWRPLTPTPRDQPGSDRDWNALSLPFVVGPHGRIGRLRSDTLPVQPAPANRKSSSAVAKPAESPPHP